MSKRILLAAAAAALIASSASAEELRIGYINTLNHPVGKEQVLGWKLALANAGWKKNGDKLGGVPTKISYCDDQFKPDVGVGCAKRLIQQDKVHIVAGISWSNILNAVRNPVVRNKVILLSTNAGSSKLAGKACSKYFISSSWQNDQTPEAMGQVMREEGLKDVFLMSPNYQAGKDMLNGFRRFYRGNIKGQILFKLGNRDFQSELTRLRASKPSAVFIFAPGPMGISFMKQWGASGLGKTVKLYSVYTVDFMSLKPIGNAAVGTFHTNFWDPDATRPATVKFIKAFKAQAGRKPTHYAAQAYDAVNLIVSGVQGVRGNIGDTLAVMKAMRRAKFESVRGKYTYNVNGMPIQNYYKREVIQRADGKAGIKTTGVVFTGHKDAYWKRCKKSEWVR